jgi:hypothetical protein
MLPGGKYMHRFATKGTSRTYNTMGNTNSRSRQYSSRRRHHSRPRAYHGNGVASCFEDPSYDDRYDRRRVSPHFSFTFSRSTTSSSCYDIAGIRTDTRVITEGNHWSSLCMCHSTRGIGTGIGTTIDRGLRYVAILYFVRTGVCDSPLHDTGLSDQFVTLGQRQVGSISTSIVLVVKDMSRDMRWYRMESLNLELIRDFSRPVPWTMTGGVDLYLLILLILCKRCNGESCICPHSPIAQLNHNISLQVVRSENDTTSLPPPTSYQNAAYQDHLPGR